MPSLSETFTSLRLERSGAIVTVMLARPEIRNAFSPALISELHHCFEALSLDDTVRVVVLSGEGSAFCAGADLSWMRESVSYTREENQADAERMAAMYDSINSLPKPLVGRINGAAIGGGAGLVACCDIAVAASTARFAFSEIKLGLIPAVIAQYVVPKIGPGHARALFLSGERFDAETARSLGLVHRTVAPEALDAEVQRVSAELLASGPGAVAAAKNLIKAAMQFGPAELRSYVVEEIATLRTSPEGQEGLAAFLEKRKPDWSL